MIRRFVTMTETVDVKAGVNHILERIEVASKSRPEEVKLRNSLYDFCLIRIFLFVLVQISSPTCGCEQNKAS